MLVIDQSGMLAVWYIDRSVDRMRSVLIFDINKTVVAIALSVPRTITVQM
jgi:hypothetical protein